MTDPSTRSVSTLEIALELFLMWRGGREAEGSGLLNRHTDKIRIGGSNPPLSVAYAKAQATSLVTFR